MDHYNRQLGCAVGRGSGEVALRVMELVDRCRRNAARLLQAAHPSQIILTFNGTDSLNQAIHGLCRSGDHVVVSDQEHNSVTRPLLTLQSAGRIRVTSVASKDDGSIDPERFEDAILPETRLVICQHASNVSGLIHPVAEIVEIARIKGCLSVIDAAQTLGCVPLSVQDLRADVVCAPGHKGLLGPLGTGILYLRQGLEAEMHPYRQGGTGARSEDELQPVQLPERYESGNHNAPGIAGLDAGLDFVLQRTPEVIENHHQQLMDDFRNRLKGLPGLRILGDSSQPRVGLVSIQSELLDVHTLASLLEQEAGIQSRAGLHCSPAAHRVWGTFPEGTLRFSLGPFNTAEDLEFASAAVERFGLI